MRSCVGAAWRRRGSPDLGRAQDALLPDPKAPNQKKCVRHGNLSRHTGRAVCRLLRQGVPNPHDGQRERVRTPPRTGRREHAAFLLCAPVLLGRQLDKRGPQRTVSPVPPKREMHERLPGRPYSACPAMGKHLATKDSRISKPRSVLPRRASAKIGFLIGLLGVQVIIAIRVMRLRNYPSFMPTYFMPLPGKGD